MKMLLASEASSSSAMNGTHSLTIIYKNCDKAASLKFTGQFRKTAQTKVHDVMCVRVCVCVCVCACVHTVAQVPPFMC